MPRKGSEYYVKRHDQIRVLISPLRQEIVDVLETLGPSSVRQIAHEMGAAPDALYYHVRKLVGVGLMREVGVRPGTTRSENVYDIPGPIRLQYDPSDRVNVRLVGRLVESLTRLADRDFRTGLTGRKAITRGPNRNLWAVRGKTWLSVPEMRELNRVLERLRRRFRAARGSEDRQPYALTWVLAPVKVRERRPAGPPSKKTGRRKKKR